MKTKSLLVILFFVLSFFQTSYAQEGFIGEIRLFAGNFAPRGWLFCDGQLLPINQNTSLFSVLGTRYGGDGRTTFRLPKLESPGAMDRSDNPEEISQTKSLGGGAAIRASFINKTTKDLLVYWIDWQGEPKYYGTIQPGKTWAVNSGTKQLWHFTHGQTLVETVALEAGKTEYNIQDVKKSSSSSEVRYIICVNGVYPSRN